LPITTVLYFRPSSPVTKSPLELETEEELLCGVLELLLGVEVELLLGIELELGTELEMEEELLCCVLELLVVVELELVSREDELER
jgi:hypothetical protein